MAKFQIEYELKANINEFKKDIKAASKSTDVLADSSYAIDKSVQQLNKTITRKGINQYFVDAKKSATALKDTLAALHKEEAKGGEADSAKLRTLNQSIKAGQLQYVAQVRNGIAESNSSINLVKARYALYDVANEAKRVGLILTGTGAIALKIGADFQRAFADVQRTTGETGAGLNKLKTELLDISRSTSISFVDISKLATIAAQMGIAGRDVASFSETIAKFSAVTNVSVETASSSFGRIAQLLGVTSDQYDNLASSVLYAGRNSVATEEQILSLTTQISASTSQAGMLADETVGLATAMASLGIQPEQARGVILRLFADFDKAVSENGKRLADYGALLNMTSEGVANLWKSNPTGFFEQLTGALSRVESAGGSMNLTLQGLGITETRATNVLQRLSGNHDLLVKSINDATTAFAKNADLTDQYAVISGTLNEKLGRLQNTLMAIGDAATSGALGPFGLALDIINNILTGISKNQAAGFLVGLSLVISTGVGIFLLYKAAVAQAMASVFAFKVAMQELKLEGVSVSLTLRGLIAEMAALNGTMTTGSGAASALAGALGLSAGAARALSIALKSILIIGVATAIYGIGEAVISAQKPLEVTTEKVDELVASLTTVKNLENLSIFKTIATDSNSAQLGIDGLNKKLTIFQAQLSIIKKDQSGAFDTVQVARYGNLITKGLDEAKLSIATFDASLMKLAASGNTVAANKAYQEIAKQAAAVGIPTKELIKLLPEYGKVALTNAAKVKALSAETSNLNDAEIAAGDIVKNTLTEAFITSGKATSELASNIVNFASALKDSGGDISAWSEGGRKAFDSFSAVIDSIIQASGTDLYAALQGSAAAINLIERAGGNAAPQVEALTEKINAMFGLKLDPTTINSISSLKSEIAKTGNISEITRDKIGALLSGGAYNSVFKTVFDKMQKQITTGATKTVKTLKDYASDMSGMFSRILEFRFNKDSGIIALKNAVQDIADNSASAKENIQSLTSDISTKTKKRDKLQAAVGASAVYGDSPRLQALQQKLTDANNELAASERDLAYNTGIATGSLDLNTKAGRDNVSSIQSLVSTGVDYVNGIIAVSGKSKETTKALEESKAATIEALKAMGLSDADIAKYTKPYDLIAKAIKKSDGKVTVKFGAKDDEAQKTLSEFIAKANNSSATVKLTASFDDLLTKALHIAAGKQLQLDIKSAQAKMTNADRVERMFYTNIIKEKTATLKSGNYAYGGLISGAGSSTSDSIPINASNGEFMMRAAAVQSYGLDFMNAINQQRVAPSVSASSGIMSSGSSGSQVVYLSPQDRSLLEAAINRPITLQTTDRVIAQSANSGNKELARRGSN